MVTTKNSGQSEQSDSRQFVLGDVFEAIESSGMPEQLKTAVRESLAGESSQESQLSDNARVILEKRYLRKDSEGNVIETAEGLFHRVSGAVAIAEKEDVRKEWQARFYEMISSLKFLPNSPTLVNAGTGRGCLSACFVVSPSDDMNSIMEVAHDAAMIEKWGGGIGFGFSKLRPKSDPISTTHGQACGPIAVMKLYSAVGATLTQGAFRLGAHMGQLRDSHPDIKEFIHCKDDDDSLQNFNISVQITDAFMEAVNNDGQWPLSTPRESGDGPTNDVVDHVSARELWNEITESAWKTGDPGVVFIDRVWETAPNPQMGLIETSNPCGEEFLEDYGNCCLGSIDLYKHVAGDDFDWDDLESTTRTAVRFLDDVIEVNTFPLSKLREVNLATRRIGLGVMGWADALVRLGVPYDTEQALELADKVAKFIKETAWDESASLAKERGAFPEYGNSALPGRGLPPVRNSSVVTIAPTGTISRLAGCSSGIEPHFAVAWWSNVLWEDHEGTSSRLLDAPASVWEVLKNKLDNDETAVKELLSKLADNSEDAEKIFSENGLDASGFRTSMGISPEAHVKMQAVWQKHVTNSVSKTINLPNTATVDDVADAYKTAWETGCKAVTVYRDGSKSMQVLETGKAETPQKEENDFLVPRQRPTSVQGITDRVRTGHGNMFVTINFDEDGRPFEVFTTHGKAGGCDAAHLDGISRLVSMALRSGVDPHQVVEHLQGITCCPVWDGGTLVRSAEDAVSLVLKQHLSDDGTGNGESVQAIDKSVRTEQLGLFTPSDSEDQPTLTNTGDKCVKCAGSLIHQEGCITCLDCGYTKCE